MSSSPRTALLAGATGLVGREILAGLLADPAVGAVHVLARRPLPSSHPKLAQQVVDFTRLPALPRVDEADLTARDPTRSRLPTTVQNPEQLAEAKRAAQR